jgi:SnoaL-like domain
MADPTITALMHANLYEVFGQRDLVLRHEAIARTYTDDVAFTDDAGTIVGPAAVDDRVQHLLQDAPAHFAFAADGPIYVDGDTAAMAWRLGPRDGEPVARGIDIATLKDGRISALRTLLA